MEVGTFLSSLKPTDVVVFFLAAFFLLHQLNYHRKKSFLPGPGIVFPFLGTAISLVLAPTKYWEDQARYAKSTPVGISGNYIFGQYMVFIVDPELIQKVLGNVRQGVLHLIGHPFGKKLFGEHNLIYMTDQNHKDLRRRLAPNFTPRALSVYLDIQQGIVCKHLNSWLEFSDSSKNPIPLRSLSRDMNLETSQTVFAGPYLTDDMRKRFNYDYSLFNSGLMKLPMDYPGSAFRKARLAVTRLFKTLGQCASVSKERMRAGNEPTCLMDFWMTETVKEIDEAAANGAPPPPHSADDEIGGHIFDFLFAAQDASTSSLLWAVALLDEHPDVLDRVRAEQRRVRPEGGVVTPEQMRELKYTEMVAKEVLRFRPPATLIPHIAACDYPLTDTYTVPKGTIIFPSVFESSFQGFPDADRFDPDRFSQERQEDQVFRRNWLMFGAGPHQCVGQRYALNHLVLFITLFTTMCDFKRERSPGCDDIVYQPTICPKDDCVVRLWPRSEMKKMA